MFRRRIALFLAVLLIPSFVYAAAIKLKDEGTDVGYVSELNVVGSNVEATRSGLVGTITESGSGGSGDNVTVNSTAADTTANFLDNIYMDFDIADGGAGGPDDITGKFEYAQTLAGNPALLVDEIIFFADTSGPGFLSEGSTADTNEQLYIFPDANGADTTSYIMLDDTSITAIDDASLEVNSATLRRAALTGDVTATAGSNTTAIGAGVIVDADMANDALDADKIVGDATDDDDLDVSAGGTGVSTLTDGGILLGSGTGDITALGVATNGQIPIGDGTTDPVLATLTGTANEVTVTNGAGTITLSLPNNAGTDISADLEEEVTEGSLADDTITEAELKAVNAAADEDLLTFESTTGDFEWQTPAETITAGDNISWTGTTLNVTAHTTDTNAVKEYVWPAPALLPIEPADAIPPITKHTGTNYDVLTRAFADAVHEEVTAVVKAPSDIDTGGTVTFRYVWFSSATTGNVVWATEELDFGEGSSWDEAAPNTVTADADAVQGAANDVTVTTDTETVSNLGWAADEVIELRVLRDGDAGGDTMTADAQLLFYSVEIPRS